ncbi:alanine racemase [Corynebacterium humireducens NBRC 106098 = DSM 45392]|uniref:Alanine racemase n=2 Tax=Corynebacterium humireducens TaxID=1223514 RepID=A0A0B5D9J7_9CORY|nr:alanine racemase [Corynebacterium humireducens NBRC 106098 = DSM 45392]
MHRNRKTRMAVPAIGTTVLLLAGCAGTADVAEQGDPSRDATGTVSLVPSRGALNGGNTVLVDTGDDTTAPITATFGDSPEVECQFDQRSARHACTAPGRHTPGTVDVTVNVEGTPLPQQLPYTYTTDGSQASPAMVINTETVRQRAQEVRAIYPYGVKLGAVLKNGEPVDVFGRVINDAVSPDYFFVPTLDDAITLRESGIQSSIAVMYVSRVEEIPLFLHYDIEASAIDSAWAEEANRIAAASGGDPLRVHLWIDTGMGREGVVPDDAFTVARTIEESPHLELVGIATHFNAIKADDSAAIAANDLTRHTVLQKNRFEGAVNQIREAGMGQNALIHAGATDVLVHGIEELNYDLMRIGGAFFGASAPEERIYSWTTTLTQVKELPAGWCLDYDCTTPTASPIRVGLVNHVPRRENEVEFTVRGVKVPALLNHGTVVTLDLSGVPDAVAGDEVTLDFDPRAFYNPDGTAPLPVTTTG